MKREKEFGVPDSSISRRLLVFTGSVDVELLDRFCCPLGVLVSVASTTIFVDVLCTKPCHSVMGVEGAMTS